MNPALLSSKDPCWRTPGEFLNDRVVARWPLVFDVCASHGANVLGLPYISPEEDALKHDHWALVIDRRRREGTRGYGWMNPPYGRGIGEWVYRAALTAFYGVGMVCLLPARTDTRWWHDFIWDSNKHAWAPDVHGELVRGRIKFVGATAGAPFPSALIVFHPRSK